MQWLDQYQFAVFDCDGVLLNSNGVKIEAFRAALADEPQELVQTFIEYHQAHGGVSRYEKFAHYFAKLRPTPNAEHAVAKSLVDYSEYLKVHLPLVEEVPGARQVLDYLQARDVPCVVISGGNEHEVQVALEQRGMSQYFQHICGSPTPKSVHMQKTRAHCDATFPGDMRGVFFGDARLDMEIAESAEFDFVFVQAHSDWGDGAAVCHSRDHRVIYDFRTATLT